MAGWKRGDIYVDMSTNSPTIIRRIAEDARTKGVAVLDAPVSGGVLGAEGGTLAIMVGGAPDSLEVVRKVLEAIGSRIVHVGDVGCGNIAKLVNNLISLTCNAITSEGFVLGVKAGIETQKLLDVITASTGNNWCIQQYPKAVLQGNFEPGFKLSLASKDIGLAVSLGREYGVPLPVGAAVEQSLLEAKAAGYGEKAVESTLNWLEKMVGIQVRLSGQ
jgi:3-hydroxyisobutyrate dehydrogenase-like beta-hydroxyacid dehydrogenase